MKHYLLLLLVLIATQAFAQKKKGKDFQIDSLTRASAMFSARVDSLVGVNSDLAEQLDSVSKEREVYYGLYTTIKEKVLKRDFDPTKLSSIIDSLAAGRDSTFTGLAAASASLTDSLASMKRQNQQMRAVMDGFLAEETAKNRMTNELRLLKELLDSEILTQAEFEARKTTVLQKWK